MRKVRIFTYIFLSVVFTTPFFGARYSPKTTEPLLYTYTNDSITPISADTSARLLRDNINTPDSITSDTVQKKKSFLEAVVDYKSKDSIIIMGNNWGYLFGDADIKYTSIELKGEKIAMQMDSSIVHATYGLDSIGDKFGYPLLNDNGTEYESEGMKYNFKSKKAFIDKVRTKQGDGLIIADLAKKSPDDAIFMCNGQYTTCDNPGHAHFYLALTKAKVYPGKNVVTGPAYLVIEDVPLFPIGIPFGFFPFTDKYSSGVIMPSFGTEMERGYSLRDGGYYFAINDNIDLALTGEIYTKGSWGLNGRSTYRKRYKFSGSFDIGYMKTILGDKGLPDYSSQTDMRINWSHTQDPKANMFRTLSASVNFSTSSYLRNNLNTAFTPQSTENTKSSNINMTQRFPNSPWTLSASIGVDQRSRDSSISLKLPTLTISMSDIAPFKRKEAVGAERWYEKIKFRYGAELSNSINTKENLLLKSSLQRDWRNGMKHNLSTQVTFNVLNYINISPSISYNERWYTSKIRQKPTNSGGTMPMDTLTGFYRVYDFNGSISLNTKIYGFFEPLFAKGTKIRHVFSPSISFSAMPDFSDPIFGAYETIYIPDEKTGGMQPYRYSPYSSGLYGTAPRGKSGSINFDFQNNFEMKTPSEKDSTGFRKISLIDNLGISFSHNLMADSLKWSDIRANLRLKITKSFTINLSGTFDPYAYALTSEGKRLQKVDKLRIKQFGSIGRLRNTGYSISHTINQDTFKKWFGKGDEDKDKAKDGNTSPDSMENNEAPTEDTGPRKSMFDQKAEDGEYDPDGYMKNEVKWNLGFSIGMNYGWDTSREPINKGNGFGEYHGKWTKTFGFNGGIQPTKNWNFTFNSSYDFDAKKLAYTTCNLTRDLHCWSLTASFTPVGPYKTYYVTLRASSQILQDLKYEERGRSSSYDPKWDY